MSVEKKRFLIYFIFSLSQFISGKIIAQCSTPLSTFPYTEDFEATNGSWTVGGTASDWAWGTPSKPVITGAASGSKCWITGGLSISSYNNSENSWLQSPCFNFSSLVHPQISFAVFWETERNYDGASFQYSTNGGSTWVNIGAVNEDTCLAKNWFNNGAVNFLGSPGWSGNIQSNAGSCLGGSGSNGWLVAKHDLSVLAGAATVQFRFRFAAGATCNNYDGFAVDNIKIDEAPPVSADFTYNCGTNNTIAFTHVASGCPSAYLWDFGDAASGTNNTSALSDPVHIFSAPGIYTVSLTTSFLNNPAITAIHTITILNVAANITNTIKCNGDMNGAATAVVSGGSGSYNYSWNTTPPQTTATANNLGAGTYSVTVSSNGACTITATVILMEPAALNLSANTTDAKCGKNNGSANATVTGGTPPYTYSWSNGANSSSITNLSPGNYSVTVTDGNGCMVTKNNLLVTNINNTVAVSLGKDTVICPGQSFVLSPGNFASYQWQDNSTASTFTVSSSGLYSVKVTDIDGCIGSASVNVIADCSDIYFPSAFTPDKNGLNDLFGALGNIGAVKNYSLHVYDRWGKLIFATTNPAERWGGTYKGYAYNTGSFAWFATYNINGGTQKMQKGTITIIR